VILLVALTTVAHADVKHEATLGSQIRALRTPSANALTGDSLVGPMLGYAHRLPWRFGKLDLWGTSNLARGFVDGEMFQTLSTHVSSVQAAVGVRALYPAWRDIVLATARIDGGVQRVSVALADEADHSASDSGWGATSTAALGVELAPLWVDAFAIGIRAELGYVVTSSIDLDARSEGAPEDTIELDRMAASLGHLDLGGRYFSLTILGRF
ncbi:MAG: hypothetical protein H0T65_22450, partial [Deltaproteobacteria bacterium]|nr:hypothetical protein [Deltaproteobacteria bacterium]